MLRVKEPPHTRQVFSFGEGQADGDRTMRSLLGGKGAGLAEMTRIGLPVPPGFTISTRVCALFREQGRIPQDVQKEIDRALALLEQRAGKRLGDPENPLLVSVRSGAEISMPGMMDTILNLGLNDQTVEGVARRTRDRRFAFDSYRRFIEMFGTIALGLDRRGFEMAFTRIKQRHGFRTDVDVTAEVLENEVVPAFKKVFRAGAGRAFPQEVHQQLALARDAVFRSWDSDRAVQYRRQFHISDELGTAVNVQAMVFGNRGDRSATGVGFTRDPATGEKVFYGEFLLNAQGEDVVAGIRTPLPIDRMKVVLPEAYQQLREITARLERHYRWPQDFEFTVEEGKLYLLQTRDGKSTALAALRWASDLMDEGLLTETEALMHIDPMSLDQLLHPVFEPKARRQFQAVAKGLAAGPGAACGRVVFTAEDAVAWARRGEPVVLVRKETVPDDVHGMIAARGILTATGGQTSHAAVVGRQLGRPCVVGCTALTVDEQHGTLRIGTKTLKEGDWISLDGSTGEVICGRVPTSDSEVIRVLSGRLSPGSSRTFYVYNRLMRLADKHRRIRVRTNADQPKDAKMALAFGAEGIGLCRTEHMFFAEDRLPHVVQMILSAKKGREGIVRLEAAKERVRQSGGAKDARDALRTVKETWGPHIDAYRGALAALGRLQRRDFAALFKTLRGHPITIRTLDPPLHEFLPPREDLQRAVADLQRGRKPPRARLAEIDALLRRGDAAGMLKGSRLQRLQVLLREVESLHEFNPMLGHRGCRLGETYPEITRMQARAMFEAAASCLKQGHPVRLEIMIPLVGVARELEHQKRLIVEEARAVQARTKVEVPFQVGVMIEVPRAALTADEIAREAEFFSFGTNDLTQLTFGYSRDDAGKFLYQYVEEKILPRDPFVSLDTVGVGGLMA
ncbi:MAG: pyruvate, phosphate dikinase, partial [Myxococcaceae bacterium]|nr:pyruvate, phosphate dikinase [Myxococcaceae bacterium]